jgi:CheY-like chemotaxis protein
MDRLSIYLAGPITGLTSANANYWRESFQNKWGSKYEVRNPLDRDAKYVGMKGKTLISAIANDERADILNCDATIAYLPEAKSMGTAMGIMYAYLSGRTVVIVTPVSIEELSPMVQFHAHHICDSFENAVNFIENRHSRTSISFIAKRDGKTTPWDPSRITAAVQAAIDAVYQDELDEADYPRPRADKLANAVVMKIEDDLSEGRIDRESLDIETVQNIVEKILVDNAHRGEVRTLAKSYIIYRRIRQEARESQLAEEDEIMRFVGDFVHDIKAPAGNIGRYIGLLEDELKPHNFEEINNYVVRMRNNHNLLMNGIINNKNLAIGLFKKNRVKLKLFVEELFKNFSGKNVFFHNNISDSIYVHAPKEKLRTIFTVLVTNSIEHGFEEKSGNIFVKANEVDHNNVLIEYWNDGNPIAADEAEGLFSSRVQRETNSKNFHHGLSQTRRYIEQLGGSIECRRNNRQFERELVNDFPIKLGVPIFRIKLPLSADVSNGTNCILIADDEPNDREMMRLILNKGGHDVLEAASIDEALRLFTESQFKGVVLDIDFKEERDGLWLLKKIRLADKAVKVIVVSGSNQKRDINWKTKATDLGALEAFDKGDYIAEHILRVFV